MIIEGCHIIRNLWVKHSSIAMDQGRHLEGILVVIGRTLLYVVHKQQRPQTLSLGKPPTLSISSFERHLEELCSITQDSTSKKVYRVDEYIKLYIIFHLGIQSFIRFHHKHLGSGEKPIIAEFPVYQDSLFIVTDFGLT